VQRSAESGHSSWIRKPLDAFGCETRGSVHVRGVHLNEMLMRPRMPPRGALGHSEHLCNLLVRHPCEIAKQADTKDGPRASRLLPTRGARPVRVRPLGLPQVFKDRLGVEAGKPRLGLIGESRLALHPCENACRRASDPVIEIVQLARRHIPKTFVYPVCIKPARPSWRSVERGAPVWVCR